MTKIIGLVQGKGGAGLSTVSTNLSGELSKVCKIVLIGRVMPQPALGKIDRGHSSAVVN
jgi:cellulose biosynthesis protein BcsQ